MLCVAPLNFRPCKFRRIDGQQITVSESAPAEARKFKTEINVARAEKLREEA